MKQHEEGNTASQYRGEMPVSGKDYINRYQQDTFVLKQGVITEIYAGGYSAQINFGTGTNNAIWLGQSQMGLSGSSDNTVPSVGARILAFQPTNGPAFILGTLPLTGAGEGNYFKVEETSIDSEELPQHKILTDNVLSEFMYANDGRPNDVLPGEFSQSNDQGGNISLLRGLAIMKAANTSQIQAHLIDNLIRIVSGTYENINQCFATQAYSVQEKLSIEHQIYTEQMELYGTDGVSLDIDEETGLAGEENPQRKYPRIQVLTGHVSDIFQMQFRGPLPADFDVEKNTSGSDVEEGSEEEQEQEINGMSSVTIDKDSRLSIRSNKGIKIAFNNELTWTERTVPYVEASEAFTGEQEDFAFSESEFANVTEQELEQDKYQERILDQKNKSIDEWSKVPHVTQEEPAEESNSYIILDKNRLLLKAGDCEIEMANGSIDITCPEDIRIRNGRNLAVLSGDNISVRSKDNMELSSTEGSIKAKAEKEIHCISTKRGIALESNAEGLFEDAPAGIQLKTNDSSSIVLSSGRDVVVYASDGFGAKVSTNITFDSSQFNIQTGNTAATFFNAGFGFEGSVFETNANRMIGKFNQMIYAGQDFRLSANSRGKIHGGPSGTDINLLLTPENFKYRYENGGGKHIIEIEKQTSAENSEQRSITFPSVETAVNPFTPDGIARTPFAWSTFDAYEKNLYEKRWQRDTGNEEAWDLLENDTIKETLPFPGLNFENYIRYTPESNINEEPAEKGGEFEQISISEYKI